MKYQTAMRLAQEQSRRTTTFSLNKKPSANPTLLPSTSSYCRNKTESSKRLNTLSIEGVDMPLHQNISNYNGTFHQQSNAVDNSRYLSSHSHQVIGLHKQRQDDVDERRDIGPSEQFQQQVSHHYNPPTKSRSTFHPHESRSQQLAVPSLNYKRQTPSKTYRHGLTVLELKEMTRSRLAAEANKDQLIDVGSKKESVEVPVSPMARNAPNCKGSLLRNIKERFHLDVFNKQKQISTEPKSTDPSVGYGQHSSLSYETTANNHLNRFGNVHTNHVAQNHSSLHHSSNPRVQDPTAVTRRYQDTVLPLQSPCSNDTFDNSSVHSFNSGIQSDYHGSMNSLLPSSQSDDKSSYLARRSAFNPIALNFDDASENGNSTHNGSIFGGSLLPSKSGSLTLSPSEYRNIYDSHSKDDSSAYSSIGGLQMNDSFQSSSDSHVTPHSTSRVEMSSTAVDDIYCGIIGQGSSDTLPTINLSTDSYCDSEESNFTPMKFGSPVMNLSTDSFCDSEDDFNFVPLNFGTYDRHVSDGAISRNGDLPNSVAESVFTPHSFHAEIKHDSPSTVFRDSRHVHDSRYEKNPSSESSHMDRDVYGRKSWDEPEDVSIAQFLGDFDSGLRFNSSTEIASSSFFLSKIDPEVTKLKEHHVT